MNNITQLKIITDNVTIESNLKTMKELSNKIKELQAEYDLIRDQVIINHFIANEEYRTTKGLLLASYKACEMVSFNQTKFKLDHPDYHLLYSEKKITHRFLLK